jgi:hypothetical protein
MDLSPYVEALRRDVAGAAAVGGPDVARAAELVAEALGPALRLVLLDLLGDAASDVTAALAGPVVDVRLRGREPELVVSFPQQSEPVSTAPTEDEGTSRLTLRLPETLKARAEQAAAADGDVGQQLARPRRHPRPQRPAADGVGHRAASHHRTAEGLMEEQLGLTGPLDVRVKVPSAHIAVTAADTGHARCAVEPLDPEHEPSVRLASRTAIRLRKDRLDVTVQDAGRGLREGELLVRLALPAGSRLTVHAGKASISVVDGIEALDASIGAGSVEADRVRQALTVRAAQCDVVIGQARTTHITTGQGTLRAEQVGDLTFKAAQGDVELGTTSGVVRVKGAAVRLVVHAAGPGEVDYQGAAGDARVTVVAGTAVQLDLASAVGRIACDLPHESVPDLPGSR